MKLKLKLLLNLFMSAVILLPAAAILLTGLVSMFSFASGMMKEEIGTVTYSQTSGLDLVFEEFLFDVWFAAEHNAVIETANWKYADVKNDADRIMRNFTENNENVLDVVITDAAGVVCADLKGRDAGSLYAGFNEEVARIGKNDTYISDILVQNSEYEGKNTFYMTRQINYNENIIGYVSLVISTDCFNRFFSGTEFFNDGGVFLIDGKGTALNYERAVNGSGQNGIVTRYEEVSNNALKSLVNGIRGSRKNTSTKYTSFEDGGFMGSYGNISSTNWIWFGLYPNSSVTAMVSTDYLTGLVIISVISAAFIIIMIVVSRIVVNPINSIIKKMNIINAGNKNESFVVNGKNEYAQISSTFNELISEVALSEELHRTVSDLSDNMLFEWDCKKERMYVSDNLLAMLNVDPKASTLSNGKFIDSLMESVHSDNYKRDVAKLLKTNSSFHGEYQTLTRNGSVIWISMRTQCVTDRLDQLLRVVGVITNIDNEKKLTLRLSERASYDFLSQLYNRSTFERELQSELERNASCRVGVIFIDVDDFKFINDRYSHSTGDEVIKHVSKVIRELIGSGGFAGRFGGDEFVMCITDEKLLDNIEKLAEKLIGVLGEGYRSEAAEVTLTIKASIGISIAPQHGKDGIILIAAADEAMYYVKKNGKCNYHVYDPDDSNLIDMMHSI